jgi:tRNA-specific 2-thiouridylase
MSEVSPKKAKALILLSGGLDSTLALSMMKEQNLDVVAVSFKTPFCNFDCGRGACGGRIGDNALKYGVKWFPVSIGEEYIDMVRNPKHGYGSGMNPCIDCRVMMYRKAKDMMKELGADFIVTGEVLGQRPMSQNRRALEIIEKESDLEGLILRPLSAQLMEPTLPEKAGVVDRKRLLAVQGRSRRVQIEMAKKIGWKDYPNPSGGCLLTEKAFSRRLRDLFKHVTHPSQNDIDLLKVGRHLRIAEACKLVVGRNALENDEIKNLAQEDDVLLEAVSVPSPVALLRGAFGDDELKMAASVVARYSDANGLESVDISVRRREGPATQLAAPPMAREVVPKLLL